MYSPLTPHSSSYPHWLKPHSSSAVLGGRPPPTAAKWTSRAETWSVGDIDEIQFEAHSPDCAQEKTAPQLPPQWRIRLPIAQNLQSLNALTQKYLIAINFLVSGLDVRHLTGNAQISDKC